MSEVRSYPRWQCAASSASRGQRRAAEGFQPVRRSIMRERASASGLVPRPPDTPARGHRRHGPSELNIATATNSTSFLSRRVVTDRNSLRALTRAVTPAAGNPGVIRARTRYPEPNPERTAPLRPPLKIDIEAHEHADARPTRERAATRWSNARSRPRRRREGSGA